MASHLKILFENFYFAVYQIKLFILQNILHYGIRGIQGPLSIYDHFELHILWSNIVKHSKF